MMNMSILVISNSDRHKPYLKVRLLATKVLVPAETITVFVVEGAIRGTVALVAAVAVLAPECEIVEVPLPPAIENCPL